MWGVLRCATPHLGAASGADAYGARPRRLAECAGSPRGATIAAALLMRRRMRPVCAVILVVAVVALALGCNEAGSPPRPDVGWYDSVLGAPADLAMVLHVTDALRDPYYGVVLRQAMDRHGTGRDALGRIVGGCDEIAIVASVGGESGRGADKLGGAKCAGATCTGAAPLVAVLYEPPAGADASRMDDDDGRPYFGAGRALPSGAVEHPGAGDPDSWLYEVPGAWIVARGVAVARVRQALSAEASAPPRFDPEPGALVSAMIRRGALDAGDLRELRRKSGGLLDSFEEGILALGHGPGGELVLRVRLTTEEAARALQDDLNASMTPDARCDSTCLLVHALLLQLIEVKRDGAEVALRVHIPEPVMRALADRASGLARRRRTSPPPDESPFN
jgi:hypothetical protein